MAHFIMIAPFICLLPKQVVRFPQAAGGPKLLQVLLWLNQAHLGTCGRSESVPSCFPYSGKPKTGFGSLGGGKIKGTEDQEFRDCCKICALPPPFSISIRIGSKRGGFGWRRKGVAAPENTEREEEEHQCRGFIGHLARHWRTASHLKNSSTISAGVL